MQKHYRRIGKLFVVAALCIPPVGVALAVEAGNRDTQTGLALLRGEGVKQDFVAARSILEENAKKGDAEAMGAYGFLISQGLGGGAPDPAAALEWLGKAAEASVLSAQLNYGVHYVEGLGTEADLERGLAWISQAAEAGHLAAQKRLAQLYHFGDHGVKTSGQDALRWAKLAGEQGDAWSQNLVGTLLQFGPDVEIDVPAAAEWYLKAAKQGNPKAQSSYGRLLASGKDVRRDLEEAYFWIKLSAMSGEAMSINYLPALVPLLSEEQIAAIDRRVFEKRQETVRGRVEVRD